MLPVTHVGPVVGVGGEHGHVPGGLATLECKLGTEVKSSGIKPFLAEY